MNTWTVKNRYPLPLIPSLIDRLRDCTKFTGVDIEWGYNEVLIKLEDRWKAAFITNEGLYEPTVMFFSLTNSPAMLPPEQAAKLLPWYMQWSRDLAAEMHRRHLI